MSGYDFSIPGSGGTASTQVGDRADQHARMWGRDIWLDVNDGAHADTVTNAAGDLVLVTGREALRQWCIRCIVTTPGEYALLPNFGCGAREYIKERNTQAKRDELAERIRVQLPQNPRVLRVVQVVIEPMDDAEGIMINVQVDPRAKNRPRITWASSCR
jgi:phage baseplate assembly protein W